jgi:hypothetical protein
MKMELGEEKVLKANHCQQQQRQVVTANLRVAGRLEFEFVTDNGKKCR